MKREPAETRPPGVVFVMLSGFTGYAYAFGRLDGRGSRTPLYLFTRPQNLWSTTCRHMSIYTPITPLTERIRKYFSRAPQQQQRRLEKFLERLIENPSAITIRDIVVISSITHITAEELLLISLHWSQTDLDLEIIEQEEREEEEENG